MQVSAPSNVTIVLSQADAEKLRRVCNFNITIADRVGSNSGTEAGQAYKTFLYNLGNQLKAIGVKRGR